MNVSSKPLVSIVIVNYNGGPVILECLNSLQKYTRRIPYEIIVVDNNSQDGSPEEINGNFPSVNLLRQSKNAGFGTANNIGVAKSSGKFIWLLNSDVYLTSNVLPFFVARLEEDPQIGILGPRLVNADGSFQLSVSKEISIRGEFQTLQQVRKYRNLATRPQLAQSYVSEKTVDIVVGAAMFMRREVFDKSGGFDQNFFMYFEESDLCKRVRNLGYSILYTPKVELIHIGGYSVSKASGRMAQEYRRSQRYYYEKHRPIWEQWLLHAYLTIKQWRS
ncbi:MAG: glycosyltransferase family 2 protein [Leptolyngbya sp. SIO3F4]|nr:glycosyltransferase family 2 protein [Leptolyngbya sp. SIO3F4]